MDEAAQRIFGDRLGKDSQIERVLRAKARKLIQAGSLPNRLPARRWGGPGSGAPCTVCGVPIESHEIDFEIEATAECDASGLNPHFHLACLDAVEVEIRQLELARRNASREPRPQPAPESAGQRQDAAP